MRKYRNVNNELHNYCIIYYNPMHSFQFKIFDYYVDQTNIKYPNLNLIICNKYMDPNYIYNILYDYLISDIIDITMKYLSFKTVLYSEMTLDDLLYKYKHLL